MRSLEDARQRWQITTTLTTSLETLRQSVRVGHCTSKISLGLRSVCWKVFFLFQNTEVPTWSKTLRESRSVYSILRHHHCRFIDHPEELKSVWDPLDDDNKSPWNTLRKNEEMRAEIFLDVQRCLPDNEYFRAPQTQRRLLDILFIYSKANQGIGYRQGMHELLAPILWVVDQDAIQSSENIDFKDINGDELLMREILHPNYIEHDAFALLSLLMRSARPFYEFSGPSHNSSVSLEGFHIQDSPILQRSLRIHEIYLVNLDPELAKHLSEIEVLPQTFLIRWIRLLFGREFVFCELLELWDFMFAEDPGLEIVDMVCVAMLLRIRWQLIEAVSSTALSLLLNYPSSKSKQGPQTFVDDAIFLRDNMNLNGGAQIINKYSGKLPKHALETRVLKQLINSKRVTQPAILPSPVFPRLIQKQGAIEVILQEAAKGIIDRGEKHGINQTVGEAVGEVKKSMQGFQSSNIGSGMLKFNTEEDTSILSCKDSAISTTNSRNQQLAHMLDQTIEDLRMMSISGDKNVKSYISEIEMAMAKVDFVRIYLEEPTLLLPEYLFLSKNSHPRSPGSC